MKLTMEAIKCDQCAHIFEEGDAIFEEPVLFRRKESNKTFCRRCVRSHLKPSYVYHQGKGVACIYGLPATGLANGTYLLEQIGSCIAVSQARRKLQYGQKLSLECREDSFTLLLPWEMQAGWPELDLVDDAYRSLWHEAEFILIDNEGNICGFTNQPQPDSKILPEDEIRRREIRCIAHGGIKALYDTSPFASKIRKAIDKIDPVDLMQFCESRVQGQGAELRKAVYLIWQYLQSIRKAKSFQAFNWFLTAPSGCGKTELFRTIRQYFKEQDIPIPVVQIDLSRITEEGFKGLDPSNIIDMIKNEASDTDGYAICFLDEADKKMLPVFDSRGTNVNDTVQSALLTLIEGYTGETDKDGDSKDFDTRKTMFVFMGAFQTFRQNRQKANRRSVGFAADAARPDALLAGFYDPLSIEDMVSVGMQEELAGRIQQVVNFRKLSEEMMLKLLRSKSLEIARELDIRIELTEQAEQELLSIAFGNLGVRKPLNKIREIALNTISAQFFENAGTMHSLSVVIEDLEHAKLFIEKPKSPILPEKPYRF